MENENENELIDKMFVGNTSTGDLRIQFVKCNCCGNNLYLEMSKHGYLAFSCDGNDIDKELACPYNRENRCYCPKNVREVVCLNNTCVAQDMNTKIRSMLIYFIYTFIHIRKYCTAVMNHRKYKIFQETLVHIMDHVRKDFYVWHPRFLTWRLFHRGKRYETRIFAFRSSHILYFIWLYIKTTARLFSSFTPTKMIVSKLKKKMSLY